MQAKSTHIINIQDTRWLVANSVNQCSLCINDVVEVAVCLGGHGLCKSCFAQHKAKLKMCPLCADKEEPALKEREITLSRNLYRITLQGTDFYCQAKGCGWSCTYENVADHIALCQSKKINCSHSGCETVLPRSQMANHEQECGKRPYQEGNLEGTYEMIAEAKQLKDDLSETAQDQALTLQEKGRLYDRIIKVYGRVLDAALTEQPTLKRAKTTAVAIRNIPCQYRQCAFIATTPKELAAHYPDCPNRPFPCQYCQISTLQKDRAHHEYNCGQRPVICADCHQEFTQAAIDLHRQNCVTKPIVACNLCKTSCSADTLEQHQLQFCPTLRSTCPCCLTPSVFADPAGCWCRKPITLTYPQVISLWPQPEANCPVYQEDKNDSSTIYLATRVDRFRQAVNPDASVAMFREGTRFTFCNRTSTLIAGTVALQSINTLCPTVTFRQIDNRLSSQGVVMPPGESSFIEANINLIVTSSNRTLPFEPFLTYSSTSRGYDPNIFIYYSNSSHGQAWINGNKHPLATSLASLPGESLALIQVKKGRR